MLHTSDIVFLASGTFDGIRDPGVISKRPPHLTNTLREPDRVVSADLVSYGFLPELIARLPILIPFECLSADHLLGILNNPIVNPTNVWTEHFIRMGKALVIEDGAKQLIAEHAEGLNMGARGLQQVMFPMLARLSYQFESSEQPELRISREFCETQLRMGW
jgi:ATP-dependent Clp protease ATP-binding subunit ClpX